MRCSAVLIAVSLPAFLFGQTTNRSYVQTTSPPLVTTPTLTLGNGITPPVITYGGTIVAVSPGDLSTLQPSVIAPYTEAEGNGENAAPEATSENTARKSFDFRFSGEDSAYRVGQTDFASLGEVTRTLKINHPDVAHRVFTNSDIPPMQSGTGTVHTRTRQGPISQRQNHGFQPETGIANQPYYAGSSEGSTADDGEVASSDSQPSASTNATTPSLGDAVKKSKDSMSGDANQLPATDPQE